MSAVVHKLSHLGAKFARLLLDGAVPPVWRFLHVLLWDVTGWQPAILCREDELAKFLKSTTTQEALIVAVFDLLPVVAEVLSLD